MRGIVIFACGHPLYGTGAYNLAMSLKAMGNVEIAVMFNGRGMSHISPDQLDYFDHVIHIDESIRADTSCKLYANKYTPFEKTLLLDADLLWLPFFDPNKLLDELEGITLTGITEGKEDEPKVNPPYFFWADVTEMKEKYAQKVMMYQWRTEVMYFNKEGGRVIDRALEIVNNHGLDSVKLFANHVPDELGVNLAAAEAGIIPHKYRWIPSYWPPMHSNTIPALKDLKDQYYFISFGGKSTGSALKMIYDTICSHSCNKFGIQHIFRLMDKKGNIPDRALM